MSSGSPPTLWWLLIFAAVRDPDSITSEYRVPCTRNRASDSLAASASKMRMNSRPIVLRFSSGSVMPASAEMKWS